MVQRCSPETCLCAGPLLEFGWADTTRLTLRLPSLGKYRRRTERNYTLSSTSLSTLRGISASWRIAWESSTRPT
eukprot:15261448-Heterocapsa_arctica.AAC.1